VTVEEGEALFEVAKDPHRPFVVRAGGSEVRAQGTVFSVRFIPRKACASERGDHADRGARLVHWIAVA